MPGKISGAWKRLPRILPLFPVVTGCAVFAAHYFENSILFLLWSYAVTILALLVCLQEFSIEFDRVEIPLCPACGSGEFNSLYPKEGLAMVKCGNCGLAYALPRYSWLRRFILLHYHSFMDVFDSDRRRMLFSQANIVNNFKPKLDALLDKGLISPGAKILDVGSGAGQFAKFLADSGYDVYGVEPGLVSAMFARYRKKLRVTCTSIEKLNAREKFDLITCLHVIEHTIAPVTFLRSLRVHLNRDGVLLIATPDFGSRKAKEQGPDWAAYGPTDHVVLFGETTLRKLVEKAGFMSLEIAGTAPENDELVLFCKLK